MQEFGATQGNIPDPNFLPAVCAALEGMGLEISQGAEDTRGDRLITSLFADAAQADTTELVTDALEELIRKPEEK